LIVAVGSDVTSWATAISKNASNGRKIIFRYAEQFSPTFERKSQPIRIIIVWRYHSESGQPVSDEHRRMNEMEDALESALDPNGFTTLALVSTGEDLREWIYYSKSEDEFMARLNFAFTEAPRYPIEIHIAADPNWDTYEQFRKSMKKETVN
jgi:Family of unknown function (DUF695)